MNPMNYENRARIDIPPFFLFFLRGSRSYVVFWVCRDNARFPVTHALPETVRLSRQRQRHRKQITIQTKLMCRCIPVREREKDAVDATEKTKKLQIHSKQPQIHFHTVKNQDVQFAVLYRKTECLDVLPVYRTDRRYSCTPIVEERQNKTKKGLA